MPDISINNNNLYENFSRPVYAQKAAMPQQVSDNEVVNDKFVSAENKTVKNDKITFIKGTGLFLEGFASRAVDAVKSVVFHPIRTLALSVVTLGALAALPAIGIPIATGSAAVAVLLGAVSAFRLFKDIHRAVKDSKANSSDNLKNDIKNIGKDSLDAVLTLPFFPKSFIQLKNTKKIADNNIIQRIKNTVTELWEMFAPKENLKAVRRLESTPFVSLAQVLAEAGKKNDKK